MEFDESDIRSLRREGARLRRPNGEPLTPLPNAKPSADEELAKITDAIQSLGKAMTALAKREMPDVTVEAPNIVVKAPEVTVNPTIQISSTTSLESEVTERDGNGYIKKIVTRVITTRSSK